MKILVVALGGALGAALRYLLSDALSSLSGAIPLGTLLVNVLGGFLMGLIIGMSPRWNLSTEARLFLTTGLLGGLTTFSTFSNETVTLFSSGAFGSGLFNVALNLLGALCACWLGHCLAA